MVGQTGCGETTFVQNLAKNRVFGDIKVIYWLSKISLPQEKEHNIGKCFNKHVNFKYPRNLEQFNVCLDFF